jgi:retron-type reverse transcriptase
VADPLIRGFLTAGVRADGLVSPTGEGTPQGGLLSLLLSNLMLNVLDRELDGAAIAFVRYADDCNIYVRSGRAGERVLASLSILRRAQFLARHLKLTVNAAKTRSTSRTDASSWASASPAATSLGGALRRRRLPASRAGSGN